MHSPLLGGPPSQQRNARLAITVAAVSIGSSLQFGFGTGSLNNLDEILPAALKAAGHPITLCEWALVVSGFSIGGLVGSLACPALTLEHGRRTVLLGSNGLVLASSALLLLGDTWYALLLGRVCIGAVAGLAASTVPMYFAEISPAACRGAVGTAHQLGVSLGILLSQMVTTPSLNLLGSADLWRCVFLVPLACALLEFIVLPLCPESPAHLYRTEGSSAALTVSHVIWSRTADLSPTRPPRRPHY